MTRARLVVGLDPEAPAGENARKIANVRLEEMYDWVLYIDEPYHSHELHALRIAAKRLRYTLEIFADVLPAVCVDVVKEVEKIQEELGALHDSDVMIALLRLCLGSIDAGSGFQTALVKAGRQAGKKRFMLDPDLVALLLDPAVVLSAQERKGLEHLLLELQAQRTEYYNIFQQHWNKLQQKNFREQVQDISNGIDKEV